VPLDQQDRIFQRFARGHNGGRRPGAAGLGLAIVRSIALAHDGRVALESRPGAGATFTFAIPSGDTDHIAEAGPERARSGQGGRS
jgi:two-component system OmpR family sensor kinase